MRYALTLTFERTPRQGRRVPAGRRGTGPGKGMSRSFRVAERQQKWSEPQAVERKIRREAFVDDRWGDNLRMIGPSEAIGGLSPGLGRARP